MNLLKNKQEYFMKMALREAKIAYNEEEIPIGAVIVHENTIISKGHNQCQKLNDSTAHAEMIAITSAQNKIGSKYLNDCELYITLEPCMMCSGAIYLSKLSKVIYALDDKEKGYIRKSKEKINKKLLIESNVFEDESKKLLESFFFKLRS
ncbi:MAG: tRNA-specific adenosine deaminase [Rhodothermaeota bacterium MED-G19]|jgi:tRNA(adenine34) deaminase|nr:MAG: tRNA-specific adenosine deaminase [Rhodothermaeota bacterium MED-G19]